MSGKTHATNSSSGSGSTVTERNYNEARRRAVGRDTSHAADRARRKQHVTASPPESPLHPLARRSPSVLSNESLDVFKYQELDDSVVEHAWESGSSADSSSDSDSNSDSDSDSDSASHADGELDTVETLDVVAPSAIARRSSVTKVVSPEWHHQDIHSDSGISVRGGTPDSSSASGSVYDPPPRALMMLPIVRDDTLDEFHEEVAGDNRRAPSHIESPSVYHPSHVPYPMGRHLMRYSHQPPQSPAQWPTTPEAGTPPPAAPTPPPQPDFSQARGVSKTGYDRVASQLSADGSHLTPVYRRFETLHHRVLLQLQDELCEMEEALARLDRSVEEQLRQHIGAATSPPPASRRNDRDFGSELHAHRHDLLGRIFAKTQQYKDAMSAYRVSVQTDPPALPADREAYREFLANRGTPLITPRETRFLEHAADLISPGLPPRRMERERDQPGALDEKHVLLGGAVLLVLLGSSNVHTLMWRVLLLLAAFGAWAQRGRWQAWYERVHV